MSNDVKLTTQCIHKIFSKRGRSWGDIVVNVLDCNFVESKFEFQSFTFKEIYEPHNPSRYALNSTTTVFLVLNHQLRLICCQNKETNLNKSDSCFRLHLIRRTRVRFSEVIQDESTVLSIINGVLWMVPNSLNNNSIHKSWIKDSEIIETI